MSRAKAELIFLMFPMTSMHRRAEGYHGVLRGHPIQHKSFLCEEVTKDVNIMGRGRLFKTGYPG